MHGSKAMMEHITMRIFPLSDSSLTIEFGKDISPELNERAVALADHLARIPFPGLIEAVPAYSSVTVFYDVVEIRRRFPSSPSAFESVKSITKEAVNGLKASARQSRRLIEIPMSVSGVASPDLQMIAERCGLQSHEVIEIFVSRAYRVFMLGFLPGFAYMGEVDKRIASPRLATPRTAVPRGSIGIAGTQTGIYPLVSPGGWNIIGQTEIKLFDPLSSTPSLLRSGDEVKFIVV
jgi:inhibitor of KinA